MKTLAELKAECLDRRKVTEKWPNIGIFHIDYELAQRAVQAREREVFCEIKEK